MLWCVLKLLIIYLICFVFFGFDVLKLIIYVTFYLNKQAGRKKKQRGSSLLEAMLMHCIWSQLLMVLGKDHKGRVIGIGGVRVSLKKAFGKECVTTESRTMLPEEVATLRREITKDVLDKLHSFCKRQEQPLQTWQYDYRGSAKSTWGS